MMFVTHPFMRQNLTAFHVSCIHIGQTSLEWTFRPKLYMTFFFVIMLKNIQNIYRMKKKICPGNVIRGYLVFGPVCLCVCLSVWLCV